METLPLETPVTNPVDDTVALEISVLYQNPPGMASLKAVVDPTQILVIPVIAGTTGREITLTVLMAVAVLQELEIE